MILTLTCPVCRVPFQRARKNTLNRKVIFCSSACSNCPNGRHLKGLSFGWVTITCCVCKKQRPRKTSAAAKQAHHFCSKACWRSPEGARISGLEYEPLVPTGECRTSLPEYKIWKGMWQRCANPKNKRFMHYGGRGISVCERWSDFALFFADMGRRPSLEHSIDRTDNNGDYAPSNCAWRTREEQMANRCNTFWVNCPDGRLLTLRSAADEFNIKPQTLYGRIAVYGMPEDMALTAPRGYRRPYVWEKNKRGIF